MKSAVFLVVCLLFAGMASADYSRQPQQQVGCSGAAQPQCGGVAAAAVLFVERQRARPVRSWLGQRRAARAQAGCSGAAVMAVGCSGR